MSRQILVYLYNELKLNNKKGMNSWYVQQQFKVIMRSEKGQTKKEWIANHSIYKNSRKWKLISSGRNQISGCLGMQWEAVGEGGESDYKGHEEAFGVMVYYLDCSDGFMGA